MTPEDIRILENEIIDWKNALVEENPNKISMFLPLCNKYLKLVNFCVGCPVFENTGITLCSAQIRTHFAAWRFHYNSNDISRFAKRDIFREDCKDHIDFLSKILSTESEPDQERLG